MATPSNYASAGALAAAYHVATESVTPFTVGIEEELVLLDAATLMPVDAIERVIATVDGDRRFAPELRACQIELITPPCDTPSEAGAELARARCDLFERIDASVLPTGIAAHPIATGQAAVTDRPRYRAIVRHCGPAALDGIASGLHVHVGVGGSERTLAVFNALRSYLPEIAALAAASPYAGGEDTGFASHRAAINDRLPQSGIPPRIRSWQALAEYVQWGASGGLFPDPSYLWWDLRPHPVHGTVEIRIADVQASVAHSAGIAALCQALVADLAQRFDEAGVLPSHDDTRIRANLWQARRHGLAGDLADLDTGERRMTRRRIAELLTRLAPAAASLGTESDLDLAWTLLAEGGAERHRRVARRVGLTGLLRSLADETVHSARRVMSLPATVSPNETAWPGS